MRARAPFRREDLRELGQLLERANEVVAMREIAAGEFHPDVIGLRHDVDNTLAASLELAEWEARHGWRATYFVLHDSPYWDSDELQSVLDRIAALGHEIGIHTNAISVALERGLDPDAVLYSALERLRGWGHRITGVVAHGDRDWCYAPAEPGQEPPLVFVNDEQFLECRRTELGPAERLIENRGKWLHLRPRPLADFGLEYESYRTGRRALYLSDSGGEWRDPGFAEIRARFPHPTGQLHILVHPCWWTDAFPAKVAA